MRRDQYSSLLYGKSAAHLVINKDGERFDYTPFGTDKEINLQDLSKKELEFISWNNLPGDMIYKSVKTAIDNNKLPILKAVSYTDSHLIYATLQSFSETECVFAGVDDTAIETYTCLASGSKKQNAHELEESSVVYINWEAGAAANIYNDVNVTLSENKLPVLLIRGLHATLQRVGTDYCSFVCVDTNTLTLYECLKVDGEWTGRITSKDIGGQELVQISTSDALKYEHIGEAINKGQTPYIKIRNDTRDITYIYQSWTDNPDQLAYYEFTSVDVANRSISAIAIDESGTVRHGGITIPSGGPGANDMVAVDENSEPGYLSDVLTSASDVIELVKVDNQLRIQANVDVTSDPKLASMSMNEINGTTGNQGSWWGDEPEWGADNCNGIVYTMKRISDAQGTITQGTVFLSQCGAQSKFKLRILKEDGTILGESDFVNVGSYEPAMLEVPMHETSVGSLNIDRNTIYTIQLYNIGINFGGSLHSETTGYNHVFDFVCGYNKQSSVAGANWLAPDEGQGISTAIPFVTFGAASTRG